MQKRFCDKCKKEHSGKHNELIVHTLYIRYGQIQKSVDLCEECFDIKLLSNFPTLESNETIEDRLVEIFIELIDDTLDYRE